MAEPQPIETSETDVYQGVRWSAVGAWGAQVVQLGISIVLARLLMPKDYGLLAMAIVFIGFLEIFKRMGFHTAIIQRRQVDDVLLSSLYYFLIAVSVLLFLATVAAAPVVAWIYGEPRVAWVTAALGLGFPLSAPCLMPFALLNRRMKFGMLAVADLTSVALGGCVSITLAVVGWGVWALVVGSLASTAIRTFLHHAMSRWRPRLVFRWQDVRSVFRFGANVTGFTTFNYFARNADNFIIGTFLGATSLGYYSLAYGILLKPRDAVTNVLMNVLFPALSRIQDDDARLKAAYLRACGAIAFVTFPMMFGLVAVAHPFVQVVLGEKWLPAVPLILILAPLGALQSVWVPVGQIFLVKDRTDWYFRIGIAQSCLTVGAFVVGVAWGTVGVAAAYALFNLFWIPVCFWLGSKLISGLRARDFYLELLPYGALSLTMCLAVLLFGKILNFMNVAAPVALPLSVLLGICIYLGAAVASQPKAYADFMKLLPRGWSLPAFLPARRIPEMLQDDSRPD